MLLSNLQIFFYIPLNTEINLALNAANKNTAEFDKIHYFSDQG